MHDNRNKEVIKRVEKGMMKANRTRNIFAIVAVAPTTFMITTVFSLGINYKENMELTSVRTSGTNANVSLAMPTKSQEKGIRDLDYVKTVGTQYMIGSVAGKMKQTATLRLLCNTMIIQNGKSIIKKQSAISMGIIRKKKMRLCCLRTLFLN